MDFSDVPDPNKTCVNCKYGDRFLCWLIASIVQYRLSMSDTDTEHVKSEHVRDKEKNQKWLG